MHLLTSSSVIQELRHTTYLTDPAINRLQHMKKCDSGNRPTVCAQAKPAFLLLLVNVEGSWEGRVFDERELKFEVGDGESLGLPAGVEKAIMAMEQEEEALFTCKPKYVCFKACVLLLCAESVNN